MMMMTKATSTIQEGRKGTTGCSAVCCCASSICVCNLLTLLAASYSGQVVKGAPKNKVRQTLLKTMRQPSGVCLLAHDPTQFV